jgi:spermidine synthase
MFATGLAAAAVQLVFLREYLSIFSGNELVIGVVLALWLLATAVGSYAGSRIDIHNEKLFPFLYVAAIILGILLLRASRLLFQPGVMIPPWAITLIVLFTQSDAAFFGGFTFGILSRRGEGKRLYFLENGGAVAGLLLVSMCLVTRVSNGMIAAGALLLFSILTCGYGSIGFLYSFVKKNGRSGRLWGPVLLFPGMIVLVVGFMLVDPISIHWKYPRKVDRIMNGFEGEVAIASDGAVFLNTTLYRADMPLPSIEQAVHVPAAMHAGALRNALVIGNAGQMKELKKYAGLSVECLETEPLLAGNGCACGAIETHKTGRTYDLVLLGSGMPSTGQSCRFYTLQFFKKMRTLTGDSGVFSFTLPLGENYLSPEEQRLKDLLQATLARAFRFVEVVPGEGYTFAASDRWLPWPVSPLAHTDYLEAYTLAALTSERVAAANEIRDSLRISTIDKPRALLLAQAQWLGLFRFPLMVLVAVLIIVLIIAIVISPKTKAALSVGTSGFAAGVYSVALLLVYQFTYGTLYSRIALLMIALTAGFTLGSRVKRFPWSDAAIGLYAALTLILLVTLPFPPLALFFACHAGIGFLTGAQFVTRHGTSWGGLYAIDLAGGVFGMALCSTLLVPYFGVVAVAVGIGILKGSAAIVNVLPRKSSARGVAST